MYLSCGKIHPQLKVCIFNVLSSIDSGYRSEIIGDTQSTKWRELDVLDLEGSTFCGWSPYLDKDKDSLYQGTCGENVSLGLLTPNSIIQYRGITPKKPKYFHIPYVFSVVDFPWLSSKDWYEKEGKEKDEGDS